jgi:hypothetical protein
MPLVILHHLLNVTVQLANKRGLKKILQQCYLNSPLKPTFHIIASLIKLRDISRNVIHGPRAAMDGSLLFYEL